MLLAGVLPFLASAVTFTSPTTFFGNVGIGTTTPSHTLHVIGNRLGISGGSLTEIYFEENGVMRWRAGSQGSNDSFYFVDDDSNNGVTLAQDATSWAAGSDIRLKENVQTLSVLNRLAAYRAVEFDWKANGKHDIGVIAQELYPLFPEIVVPGNFDTTLTPSVLDGSAWQVLYDKIGPLALQGVKELNLKLEDLATTTTEIEEGSFPFRFFAVLNNRLIAWFADATNGITTLFAREVRTEKLCVGDTCVTPEQFEAVFGSQGAATE